MSVDLSLMPSALPEPKKPRIIFFIFALVILLVLGVVTTFIIGYFSALSVRWFWLGCVLIPIILWLSLISFILYQYGYAAYRITVWNEQYELRRNQLIQYARRALYTSPCYLHTEYGTSANVNNVTQQLCSVKSSVPNGGESVIAHSALSLPERVNQGDFIARLLDELEQILKHYTLLPELSRRLPLHIRFLLADNVLSPELEQQCQQYLSEKITIQQIEFMLVTEDSNYLETWLDNSQHDNDLLLVIAANLFALPKKNEAEFVSAFLFLGEQILPQLANYPINKNDMAIVYRPEQTKQISLSIDKVLLWGDSQQALSIADLWLSNLPNEDKDAMFSYLNQIGMTQIEQYSVDNTIGNAQKTDFWLALALAIGYAISSKKKQLIVANEPAIVCLVDHDITKNKYKKREDNI